MKFLCISDVHGNIDALERLDDVFKTVDAVLFAGDFAECFKPETSEPVLQALVKKHDEIYAVLGNCDLPDFSDRLTDEGINAERTLNYTGGVAVIGSGGASVFTGKTPNERSLEDLQSDFSILDSVEAENSGVSWRNLIVVSHNPPKAEKVDSFAPGMHAGSGIFTDFIREKNPLFVLAGHIHEGAGIEKIGETLVMNPGSLGENGTYGILTVRKVCEKFVADCRIESIGQPSGKSENL